MCMKLTALAREHPDLARSMVKGIRDIVCRELVDLKGRLTANVWYYPGPDEDREWRGPHVRAMCEAVAAAVTAKLDELEAEILPEKEES